MMTSQAHCKKCGRFLSRDDQNANYDHCHKCRQSVFSGHKDSNINMEEKKMKKWQKVLIWIGAVVFLVAGLPLVGAGFRSGIVPLWKWGFNIKNRQQSVAAVDTSTAAASATSAPAATSAPTVIDSNADTTGKVTEQNYVPHPRRYEETGIEGTKTWKNIVVNDDEYLVVGGLTVDGTNDGVYRGYGPGTYTITVTNGFISVVDDSWGDEEFDFRVGQAVEYGWAHAHVDRGPIPK